MTSTHPCDACGGSGVEWEPEYWSPEDGLILRAEKGPCPVCLGAGHFSDRMPAKDALADAETLRAFLLTPEAMLIETDEPACLAAFLSRAWVTRDINRGQVHGAAMRAMKLASDARRAVPGLR